MTADRLLAHYEKIADAPNAIPRLRRFILDLAVRGKLVEQDPADEPARLVLKRIAAEKARMVKYRKSATKRPLSLDEIPFSLPFGWFWSHIGELCTKTGSGSTPRGGKEVYRKFGIPFLRSQNVYDDGLRLDDVAYIGPEVHHRMAGTAVRSRDLLLNITGGSLGRCCRVPDEFGQANVSQHVAIIRLAISEMADFLHRLVLSPYFQAFIFDEQTGAGRGGLPKYKMDRIPVAVPPLPEQRRIVVKVDELMALCDRLEEARTEREETRDRLSAGSLARLNAPDPNPAIFRKHATFALDNLVPLTARPDQIKALRQTILNLAVRGKLVPQDPADEPASKLLKRIAEEKARLVKERKIWKPKSFPKMGMEPFAIPNSWRWLCLGEIGFTQTGTTPTKSRPENYGNDIPFIKPNDLHSTHVDYTNEGLSLAGVAVSRRIAPRGSVLMVCIGTIGKCQLIDRSCSFNQQINAVSPYADTNSRFLLYSLKSSYFQDAAWAASARTTIAILNKGKWERLLFPLPPLAEQHRIVAKVDELMALCDRLETGLDSVEGFRTRLLDSLLHEAMGSTFTSNGETK